MFSLVVPVYCNEGSIPDLIEALTFLNQRMGGDFEAVLVIDGSPDQSLQLLQERLPDTGLQCQVLVLSRNFGSFAAIKAGLQYAQGQWLAVMAADLQEPPELILDFRQRLESGDCDIVVGRRSERADPFITKISSAAFWWTYRKVAQREMIPGGVDIFGCSREVRDRLVALSECNSTLVGLLFWLGYRRCDVSYKRLVRQHGTSAWSAARRFRYLLDSLFAFTVLPIRLLSLLGIAGLGTSVLLAIIIMTARATGSIEVPGYTATVLVVMFFGGLNSAGLGLIGEYLWRTFENTKARPPYIIARSFQYGTNRHIKKA